MNKEANNTRHPLRRSPNNTVVDTAPKTGTNGSLTQAVVNGNTAKPQWRRHAVLSIVNSLNFIIVGAPFRLLTANGPELPIETNLLISTNENLREDTAVTPNHPTHSTPQKSIANGSGSRSSR